MLLDLERREDCSKSPLLFTSNHTRSCCKNDNHSNCEFSREKIVIILQFITWWKLLGNPGSHFKCVLRFVKWHIRRQNLYQENSHLPDGALTAVIASCTDILWRSVSIGAWNTIRTVHLVTMDTNTSFSCTLCHTFKQSMQCYLTIALW